MNKISVEQMLMAFCIKYDRLKWIVDSAFVGSTSNTLNVYLDLYSILKPLYSNKNFVINDYTSVTSCIVNIVSHYREFFRNKYGVSTTFYIVYSKNTPYINKQFQFEYNIKNEFLFNTNKVVDDMIQNNIDLLSILCPYLPDIHFISGTFETGVIMYDIICRNELIDSTPSIIITKDIYNYQLCSLRHNVIILRPKKNEGIDNSYYINNVNVITTYISERKIEPRVVMASPELLSLIMAMSSLQERNIKLMYNITSAIKLIEEAIKASMILNGYNSSLVYLMQYIQQKAKVKVQPITLEHRFKSIDIQFQHSIYINSPECKLMSFKNLYDPKAVKDINNQYFISNPLDLNRL